MMNPELRKHSVRKVALAAAFLVTSFLLAGCGSDKEPHAPSSDPAMSGALNQDIMVDPDMAGEDGTALSAGEDAITLPAQDRSPEAIADARKKALALAGGVLKEAPDAREGAIQVLSQGAATAAQVAKATRSAKTDCTASLAYSNTWAARVPADLPIYPRGAVQEAAGVAKDGCAMIVVNYATPLSPAEIIGFYYTMADKAGFSAQYRKSGAQYALGGKKGGKAYVVYVNPAGRGVTEVNLVTSGE